MPNTRHIISQQTFFVLNGDKEGFEGIAGGKEPNRFLLGIDDGNAVQPFSFMTVQVFSRRSSGWQKITRFVTTAAHGVVQERPGNIESAE